METSSARVAAIAHLHRAPAMRSSNSHWAALDAAELRIDGWLVEPTLNLLTRDAVTVRLRAQLMDLLLCLASRPGKVFGKAELVAEVWEGRWIAQSALSRCVAELRAALGDDAQQPRVIQTITKRGYRLIAPVEAVAVPDAAAFPIAHVTRIEPSADVTTHEAADATLSLWQRFKAATRPLGTTGEA